MVEIARELRYAWDMLSTGARMRGLVVSSLLAGCGDASGGGTAAGLTGTSGDVGGPAGTDGTGSTAGTLTTGTSEASGTGEATGTTETSDTAAVTEPTTGSSTTSTTTGDDPDDPCPRVRVVVDPADALNVRPTPSTAMEEVAQLANGTIVPVLAIVQGEPVDGADTWYEVAAPSTTGFVFAGFVECTHDAVPTSGLFLPLTCGTTAVVSLGNAEGEHTGAAAYAFDFAVAVDTPLVATEAGTVTHLFASTMDGAPCWSNGGPECANKANFVTLRHEDGTATHYRHLNAVMVEAGQAVSRGAPIGLAGATGFTAGPHAHVARQADCGLSLCPSIALQFADVGGDGVPGTGEKVTSQNCPP